LRVRGARCGARRRARARRAGETELHSEHLESGRGDKVQGDRRTSPWALRAGALRFTTTPGGPGKFSGGARLKCRSESADQFSTGRQREAHGALRRPGALPATTHLYLEAHTKFQRALWSRCAEGRVSAVAAPTPCAAQPQAARPARARRCVCTLRYSASPQRSSTGVADARAQAGASVRSETATAVGATCRLLRRRFLPFPLRTGKDYRAQHSRASRGALQRLRRTT
jgi:hypothetical protein